MSYRIEIYEVKPPVNGAAPEPGTLIYQQTVGNEALDLPALIATVNRKRRAPRTPKVKGVA